MIPGIVLAAGKSTRMGRPKANLALGEGETFLSRIIATLRASEVDDVLVVVGHDKAAILAALSRTGAVARIVENPDYERGQLSSMIAGLNAIDRPGVVAAMFTLVDVPLVSVSTVRAVVERYRKTHAPIVRPVRGDQHGHPVLVDRSLFDEVRHADHAAGAKAVVRAHVSAAGDVIVDDDGAFLDIDTTADYEAALGPNAPRLP